MRIADSRRLFKEARITFHEEGARYFRVPALRRLAIIETPGAIELRKLTYRIK
jgi:hypothetical protein